MTQITVSCGGCGNTYHIGADAAVVTTEGVSRDFGGQVGGGDRSDPDLVAPYPPGRSPSPDVLREVEKLLQCKATGAKRFWKCNPCGAVNQCRWDGSMPPAAPQSKPEPKPTPPPRLSRGYDWRSGPSISAVPTQSLIAESDTMEGAVAELRRMGIEMMIVEQFVSSHGSFDAVEAADYTVDAALAAARAKVPASALDHVEKVLEDPGGSQLTVLLEAESIEAARELALRCPLDLPPDRVHTEQSVARKNRPPRGRTVDVFVEREPRNGFAGLFARPGRFRAEIRDLIQVRIEFRMPVRVRATMARPIDWARAIMSDCDWEDPFYVRTAQSIVSHCLENSPNDATIRAFYKECEARMRELPVALGGLAPHRPEAPLKPEEKLQDSQQDLFTQIQLQSAQQLARHRANMSQAIENGDVELIRKLLDGGQDPNTPEATGWTPLAVAAREGKHEVVKLLLERGADVEKSGGDGTPLYCAVTADFQRINVRQALGRERRQRLPPNDVIRTVEVLLAHGANVNAESPQNTSILQMAVVWCAEPVVRRLLEAGANPNVARALWWAKNEKRADIAALLAEYGASLDETPPVLRVIGRAPAPTRTQPPAAFRELAKERSGVSKDESPDEDPLRRLVQTLSATANPLLIGQPRHCKSIVYALSIPMADGTVPPLPANRVFEVDLLMLLEHSERCFELMADKAGSTDGATFLIEDLPRLLLMLKPKNRWTLWSAFLTGRLASSAFRCIGTTAPGGYCAFLDAHPVLAPHCLDMYVPLCTRDERRAVLTSLVRQYVSLRLVDVEESALFAALDFADGEAANGPTIETALSLLDRSTARVAVLRRPALPGDLRDLQSRLELIRRRLDAALANHHFEKAEFYKDEQWKEQENLAALVKKHGINPSEVRVTREDVAETWRLERDHDLNEPP